MSDSTASLPNGFDILKNMWEAFSPPSAFTSPLTTLMQSATPLLDPQDIENRIAEMRAVEQWLTLNLNVLRSTIQAFEVQRATYATLRAFGSGMSSAAEAVTPKDDTSAASVAAAWPSPFPSPSDVAPAAPSPEPAPEASSSASSSASAGASDTAAKSPFSDVASAYAALDPSLWFSAMRSQFDQIAAAAQAASGTSVAQAADIARAAQQAAGMGAAAAPPVKPAATPKAPAKRSASKTAKPASKSPKAADAMTAEVKAAKPVKATARKTAAVTSVRSSPGTVKHVASEHPEAVMKASSSRRTR